MGLRLDWLGSEALSWRDLLVIVKQAEPGTPLYRAMSGEHADWGVAEHLLAKAVDALQGANWQRGGGSGPRPEPVPRPGLTPPQDKNRWGTASVPLDEMADWLAARNPRQARLN